MNGYTLHAVVAAAAAGAAHTWNKCRVWWIDKGCGRHKVNVTKRETTKAYNLQVAGFKIDGNIIYANGDIFI